MPILQDKLKTSIPGEFNLEVDGLGIRIIAQATQKKSTISDKSSRLKVHIEQIIQQLILREQALKQRLLLFRALYLKSLLSPFNFKSASEWQAAEKQSWDVTTTSTLNS